MPLTPSGDVYSAVAEMSRQRRARAEGSDAAQPVAPGFLQLLASFDQVLDRRKSVRTFIKAPLSQAQVLAVIEGAYAAERMVWDPTYHGRSCLTILLGAVRVAGLGGGVHAVDQSSGTFTLLAPFGPEPFGSVGELREDYADAPALLLVCGRPTGNGTGYAPTLIRAAVLGHAAWLTAISAGLDGCLYGRTSHLVTNAARRHDRYARHLFTLAIGAA